MIGDCNLGWNARLTSRSGRPISTIIINDANNIADTAMISAMRVIGVLHWMFANRNMAVIKEPTRLMATKKTKFEM